jgi:hypothetical protein
MIKRKKHKNSNKLIAGWREWAQLPDLGIELIKVKIDTGAKTSSIHAFDLVTFTLQGTDWVQFDIHPLQENDSIVRRCTAPVVDHRWITSSTGHRQRRFVIHTLLKMGDFSSPIEISLANRDEMGFRMLIGRNALKGQILVDSSHSFLLSHKSRLTKW